jgi:hypothetical protein
MIGKGLPGLRQSRMIGGPERQRLTQLEHAATLDLREGEAGMGPANVGRNELGGH